MTAIFPASLPSPSVRGYSETRQDTRRRRAGDTGPPRYARRFSAVTRMVQMEFMLSLAELAEFERFHIDDLQECSLPFTMRDPVRDGRAVLTTAGDPVLDGDDTPLLISATNLCLIDDVPSVSALSHAHFRVGFTVAVLP